MRKRIFLKPPVPIERKELQENPVKLCHDITRLSRAKARETTIEGVMSQPGARMVLSFLAHQDGITQRAIVEATHLRPPTVSVIIGKMQEENMITIEKNPADRRQTVIYLTDYGKEVDMKGIAKIKETDSLALDGLSEEEVSSLMVLLDRMKENLLLSLSGEERGKK